MSSRLRARQGFTLVELLVVVAIMMTIGSLAFPRFGTVQIRAHQDVLSSALARLVQQEEMYFNKYHDYSDDPDEANLHFNPEAQVSIAIVKIPASNNSWFAVATYLSDASTVCAIALGDVTPPGYTNAKIECQS